MLSNPDKQVYFILHESSPAFIKIGCSANSEGRLASLRTCSPFPLKMLAVVRGGHCLEFALHERWEWFKDCPEIRSVIAEILSGTFDPTPLIANAVGDYAGLRYRYIEKGGHGYLRVGEGPGGTRRTYIPSASEFRNFPAHLQARWTDWMTDRIAA